MKYLCYNILSRGRMALTGKSSLKSQAEFAQAEL